MHIANPDQAVALNAVPNIILHVQNAPYRRPFSKSGSPVHHCSGREPTIRGKVHINQDALYTPFSTRSWS